ncbi:hypothetical protein B0H15DRAFT_808471 [Mycena belliarum]|uniref:MFS general substrate transporter n=1 Tax=Mycena belliarum TaxID=1033014 RepID=A0AAD6UIF8_9AGAR|nr:hypothetical protein B0H15DRAFT_808471 [Mycena belliae]
MDGESSPLLGGTPTPTLHDSDSDSYNSQDPRASVSWLIPVVVMATLSTALTTRSRNVFFRQLVCEDIGGLPSTPDPTLLQINEQALAAAGSRLDCSSSLYSSGLLSINLISMIATCVLSALSTGWWSRLGDAYGRRYVLMVPVIGSIISNLIFVSVAGNPALEGLAQPCIFVGLLLEGFFGGSATFSGAVHAYAADVSFAGSWSTVFSVLQGLLILCTVLGNWIGLGTDLFRPFLSFGISAAIAAGNLTFIFFFLPESLPEEFQLAQPLKMVFKDIKSSIYSTVFGNGHRLAFFALALFLYSLTSSAESFHLLFVLHGDQAVPTPFSPSLFASLSILGRMATFFGIFPAMLYLLQRRSPLSLATSTKNYFLSVMAIDGPAARYSVAADFLSQLLIIFVPAHSAGFFALALMTPLTVGIKPALYSLSAVHSEILGRASRRGALFGALSVVGMVGDTLSYVMYVSAYHVLWESFAKAAFMLTAALLALVAIFLWPGEPERGPRDAPERIRIIISDSEAVDQDPSTFSPVYRRHGTNHGQDRQ